MIPEAAVEAAGRALFFQHSNTNGPSLAKIWDDALSEDLKSPFKRDALATLQAAAPHILSTLRERIDDYRKMLIEQSGEAEIFGYHATGLGIALRLMDEL